MESIQGQFSRAGSEYVCFNLKNWPLIFDKIFNKNINEILEVNFKFMDEQVSRNCRFFFSHDPRITKGYSLQKEWEYLRRLGYSIKEIDKGVL